VQNVGWLGTASQLKVNREQTTNQISLCSGKTGILRVYLKGYVELSILSDLERLRCGSLIHGDLKQS